MALTDWFLIGWLPTFVLYSWYKVKRNRYFIAKFQKAGLLAGYEYEYFIAAYTGWLAAFRWLPGSSEYPTLHEDKEFRQFWLRSGYATFALILLGGLLIYIFVSPDQATSRMPARPRFH